MGLTKEQYSALFYLLDEELRNEIPTDHRILCRETRQKLRELFVAEHGDGGMATQSDSRTAVSFLDGQLVRKDGREASPPVSTR